MKKGTRLYINLTNKCNTNCPFCCMYSGTDKNNVYEMVFHTNSNLCGGWINSEEILDKYEGFKLEEENNYEKNSHNNLKGEI